MTLYRCGVFLAALLLAASPWARAQQVVITDTFSGGNNVPVENRWPDTINLPGVPWQVVSINGTFGAALNAVGLASFVCGGDASGAIALPISSQGAYAKPPQFTISADIGAFTGRADPLLGFYSALQAQGGKDAVATNFTGLKLVCSGSGKLANGTLVLYENGVAGTSVTYTGTFNVKAIHRLSYDVDTRTGAISNVSLLGSTSDYSVFKTSAFTDAATAYAGVAVISGGRDSQACADNFKIVAGKGIAALLPNTSPPAAPTGLTAAKGREGWNSIQLNWQKSYGSYSIYRGTSAGGEAAKPIASGLVTPTYVDRETNDDFTYYYKIRATNPNGSSSDSNEASFKPVNPLYRDRTAYPPYNLSWNTSTDILQVRSVYPHLFLQRRALVATETGLLLSDDDGRTWTNLPEAAVDKIGPVNDIAFHPVQADTFYLASQTKGVWVTTDNGKTFTQIGTKTKGLAADAVTSLIIYPGDSAHQTLLAAHGGAAAGLSQSRDAGKTWDVVNTEYHFRRLFGAEGGRQQFYLFGSTIKEPDIQSVYTCSTVGEFIAEVVRDVVPTDLVFAPVPWRQESVTYLTTADSGLYRIDNSSQFGMAFNVDKLPYPGVDGWASVGVSWGPTADTRHIFLYDPTKLGLLVVPKELPREPEDITQGATASNGLPVSPLTKEGAVLRPNANGTVCYAAANGALSVGREPDEVPVVDFNPGAFEVNPGDANDWKELSGAFGKFAATKGSSTDAAKALCRQVPDLESLYHRHQVTVTARVPVKPTPPRSVTIDLSRYGGLPAMELYDDGQHNDGAAGDGVYGITFLFLPSMHATRNEDPEWRVTGPGRVAMGVIATYADGKCRGSVGIASFSQQLLDLPMWNEGLGGDAINAENGVMADTFVNPLAPGQPAYAPRRHKGDVAVRLKVPKGPWTVHFKTTYNRRDIDGYAGLAFSIRLDDGQAPTELYLQLRDEPEFSPPTTTDKVRVLNAMKLTADYQRIAVPMSQVLGTTSPLQINHLAEIIISGDSPAPATLVIDDMTALATYPPPTAPEPPK